MFVCLIVCLSVCLFTFLCLDRLTYDLVGIVFLGCTSKFKLNAKNCFCKLVFDIFYLLKGQGQKSRSYDRGQYCGLGRGCVRLWYFICRVKGFKTKLWLLTQSAIFIIFLPDSSSRNTLSFLSRLLQMSLAPSKPNRLSFRL